MRDEEAILWFKEYSKEDGFFPNHKPSLCAIKSMEILKLIEERISKYYKCENLFADSPDKVLFDISMMLKDKTTE